MDALDILTRQYTEPHRVYHTLSHIGYMFDVARQFDITLTPEQTRAIWWHDAVYNLGSNTNEEDSVDLMMRNYGNTVDPESLRQSAIMIMATKTHEPATEDEAVVCDLDMFALSDPSMYAINRSKLFDEYAHKYTVFEYNEGRLKFLKSLMDKKIFHSKYFTTNPYFEWSAKNTIQKDIQVSSSFEV